MSLGEIQKRTYLNIKQGKIFKGELAYDYVQGRLKSIEKRDRDFKGETVRLQYWYINLESLSTGELFSLAVPCSSGLAVGLLNSLGSLSDITQEVKIQPYVSGLYNKVSIYSNGERLNWLYPELPPIVDVIVGERIIKDDSNRRQLIEEIVKTLNERIG